jgi:hypothetical protein
MSCPSCSRACIVSPSNHFISLKILEKFVKETIELNYKWNTIKLIGGEPTGHPELERAFQLLKEYKTFSPTTCIQILTNGQGWYNNKKHLIPRWVEICNGAEQKKLRDAGHHACYVAPIDINEWDDEVYNGCSTFVHTGIGLGNSGYYICPLGNTIQRVFELKPIGKNSLKEIILEEMLEEIQSYCKYCGWYLTKYRIIEQFKPDTISNSYAAAFNNYNQDHG